MFEFNNCDSDADDVIHHVPNVRDKMHLFTWYNRSLNFPYFGYNWDSLYDLLCDLSWLPEKHLWICHDQIPRLPANDLVKYIEILRDVANSWKGDSAHTLHIVFPLSYKSELDRMCQSP